MVRICQFKLEAVAHGPSRFSASPANRYDRGTRLAERADMPNCLEVAVERRAARITLNRPGLHNAFDDALITELIDALNSAERDPDVRAAVLTGTGPSFSAGADMNWMRAMAQASEAANRADAARLALLMRTLNFLAKPTIARVNGAAFGGGVGLVACCDIAIAADTATFGLSEVKLGLVPAVISPYVVGAIGQHHARRLFTTGETFDASEALRIGLIHRVVPAAQLDAEVSRHLALLAKGAPIAQREAKMLALRMGGATAGSAETLDALNAALIARLRVSPEGQEGLGAFLDKRPPRWAEKD